MGDIVKDRADWLLDAVATSTQDRQFARGDGRYDYIVGDAILLNGEKAMRQVEKDAFLRGVKAGLAGAARAISNYPDAWDIVYGIDPATITREGG